MENQGFRALNDGMGCSGTQFTCFTGTKVLTLTQKALLQLQHGSATARENTP
jgi:hypothetical protein